MAKRWRSSPVEHEVLRDELRKQALCQALIRSASESVGGRPRYVVDPAELEALRRLRVQEQLK